MEAVARGRRREHARRPVPASTAVLHEPGSSFPAMNRPAQCPSASRPCAVRQAHGLRPAQVKDLRAIAPLSFPPPVVRPVGRSAARSACGRLRDLRQSPCSTSGGTSGRRQFPPPRAGVASQLPQRRTSVRARASLTTFSTCRPTWAAGKSAPAAARPAQLPASGRSFGRTVTGPGGGQITAGGVGGSRTGPGGTTIGAGRGGMKITGPGGNSYTKVAGGAAIRGPGGNTVAAGPSPRSPTASSSAAGLGPR